MTKTADSASRLAVCARVFLAAVLLAGFGIRLVRINDSRLSFHSARQYLGLRVARWEYLRHQPNVAAEVRRAAKVNADNSPRLEPRALEVVVAAGYLLLGGEKVWLGGAVSSLLWVLGGGCLFLLARRLASDLVAWIALAIHLFLPWGVVASRTFQPDPAMVAALLASLLALSQYHQQGSRRLLLVAAVLAAMSALLKPTAVFLVVGALLGMWMARRAFSRITSRDTLLFALVALGPPSLYYGYQLALGGDVTGSAETSFLPRLFTDASYWLGWSRVVNGTVSWPLLLVALVSAVIARHRPARSLVAGLLAGYALLGLVFNYHVHSHSYYSLPLVPITALGVGMVADAAWVGARRLELYRQFRVLATGAAVVLALALASTSVSRVLDEPMPSTAEVVRRSQAIGEAVDHSTNTVMLTADYGYSLSFEGSLSGVTWPTKWDFYVMQLRGVEQLAAKALFETLRPAPDWFIVTAPDELKAQPGLRALLAEVGDLSAEGPGYLVYDLRGTR